MPDIFVYALMIPLLAILVGLFSPSSVLPSSKNAATRWRVVKIWGGLWVFGLFVTAGLTDLDSSPSLAEEPDGEVEYGRALIVDTLHGPWLPRQDPDGFGAEIQVVADITEDEVVSLGREIAARHSGTLLVTFYRSRESWEHYRAFDTDPNHEWDPELTDDLVFSVLRGISGRGTAFGRWLASEGDFGHLAGIEVDLGR